MGMDNNASLYRPKPHDQSYQLHQVCAVCRHRVPPPDRSVCDTCVPPDEGEIVARANARRLANEIDQMQHKIDLAKDAGDEAARKADRLAVRVAELEQALKRLACYAATSQDENAPEWMAGLVDHLNQAAVTLNQPTQFVLHKTRADGHLWITAETIP